jgi:hypothetical protein
LEKRLICFIHIEKAAGTTLHNILANNFTNYLTISPTFYWSNEPGNNTTAKELAWLMRFVLPTEAIGGHPLRNYLSYDIALKRPVQYVTFLREPVSRYLSHFKHQKFAKKIQWDMGTFLDEPRFNNYMTRRISPTGNLEEAKRIIGEMAFVGITENFDESLLLMKHHLSLENFNPFYEKENVSKAEFSDSDVLQDAGLYQRIIKNNTDDIELYHYAKEVVFRRFQMAYGTSLDDDLKKFREKNKNYRFSPFFQLRTRFYRLLYYKPLQYLFKFLFH